MAEFLSTEWLELFQQEWNAEPEVKDALAALNFNSVIAYGLTGENKAKALIRIENGEVTYAGSYAGQQVTWDIRAEQDQWMKFLQKAPSMMSLGMAFTSGKITFEQGDYSGMLKDPRLANPFLKSFAVMGRVQ